MRCLQSGPTCCKVRPAILPAPFAGDAKSCYSFASPEFSSRLCCSSADACLCVVMACTDLYANDAHPAGVSITKVEVENYAQGARWSPEHDCWVGTRPDFTGTTKGEFLFGRSVFCRV